MSKIFELEKSIATLDSCIKGLAGEIQLAQENGNFSLAIKKEIAKSRAENLLTEKEKLLAMEKFNQNNQLSGAEKLERQKKFQLSNNSYGILKNSYPK